MELMEELGSSFSVLYRKRLLIISKELKYLDINTNQSILIINIGRNKGLRQNQLCELLGLEKTNLSKIIKSLESRDIIRKEYSFKNSRYAQIYLTNKGEVLEKKIRGLLSNLWSEHLDGVSLEEKEIFVSIINRIIININKDQNKK